MRARALELLDGDFGLRRLGQRLERLGHVGRDLVEIDDAARRQVNAHLDAAQRQQIVDKAGHAGGLAGHDAEKAHAGVGIVARRALQRLDEAAQRSQRRAQLVTGVGDEIGAHLGELVLLGQVAERDQQQRQTAQLAAARQARDGRRDAPLDGDALEQLHHDRLRRRHGLLDGRRQIRIAGHVAQRLARPNLGEELAHQRIVMHDVAGAIERERRLGNGIHQSVPRFSGFAIARMAAASAAFEWKRFALGIVGAALDRDSHNNGRNQSEPRQCRPACRARQKGRERRTQVRKAR